MELFSIRIQRTFQLVSTIYTGVTVYLKNECSKKLKYAYC